MGNGICRIFGCGCLGERGGGDPLKYDPDFKGPVNGKQRWPTDVIWLVLFIVFVILLFTIGIYSWAEGHPQRLINPVDSEGRLCGVDDGVEDKPYLLYFDLADCIYVTTTEVSSIDTSLLTACPTPQVCVEDCPSLNEVGVRNYPICVDGINTAKFTNIANNIDLQKELSGYIDNGLCAPYYLDSTDLAQRCVPTIFDDDDLTHLNLNNSADVSSDLTITELNEDQLQDIEDGTKSVNLLLNEREFLLDVYQDLAIVWPGLLIGVFGCLLLAFLYLVLLRYFAPIIVWGGILLAFVLLLAIMIVSWYEFALFNNPDLVDDSDLSDDGDFIDDLNSELDWWEYQEQTWLAIAIISTLLFLILLLALCCLRKRIQIAIALIKVASKAVGTMPSTLFYPLVTWTLLVILVVYWTLVAVCLATASDSEFIIAINDSLTNDDRDYIKETYNASYYNNSECSRTGELADGSTVVTKADGTTAVMVECIFEEFDSSDFLKGIQLYHLFGLFWIGNWILALGECVLAGAFATYYWTYNKKDVPSFEVFRALGRTLVYHTGSIAFGALIVTIVQIIRYILDIMQRQLKKRNEAKWARILLACFQCCFWCLEKILRYVDRQAYIEIAIYGYNFCVATCKVVNLLLRNIVRTAVKDNIVRFLLFLGEICIVGIVAGLSWLTFGGYTNYGEDIWGRRLNYYLIPILLLTFVAYLIAAGFTGVFLMAVDTVFICFLEDMERNNGKDKPYFMDQDLLDLMNLKNNENEETPLVKASHIQHPRHS